MQAQTNNHKTVLQLVEKVYCQCAYCYFCSLPNSKQLNNCYLQQMNYFLHLHHRDLTGLFTIVNNGLGEILVYPTLETSKVKALSPNGIPHKFKCWNTPNFHVK